MLITIIVLTALLFSTTYPLCFWISHKDPLKNNFHRFHLGLPTFVAGAVMAGHYLADGFSWDADWLLLIWTLVLLGVTAFSWEKQFPNTILVTLPSVFGVMILLYMTEGFSSAFFISLLAGLILSSATYAMNLGHWYLNVHGLPIRHLERSVNVLGVFLILRVAWDFFFLLTGKTGYQGDIIALYRFLGTMEGFLLNMALLLGTLFPLVSLYFVRGTLQVKSTQSATGILYVVLSAVLLGDLTYKYYLIRYGIVL